jgi:hypothetical protein
MQLRNIQQQIIKCVEVCYECMLKLTNYLQIITIDILVTIVFKARLFPYLILAILTMK